MTTVASRDCFPIEGREFIVGSGLWRTHIEGDPDQTSPGDTRVFLLKFGLLKAHKSWSGERVRWLKLTTSRAGLVVEALGNFLPQVVEGFLLDEKPEGEQTCFRRD